MAAVKNVGFGPHALGMMFSGEEMKRRARAFWGPEIEEGDPIDLIKAQSIAQDRYLKVLEADPRAAIVFPLVDLINPVWVRKAIYDPTYGNDGLLGDVKKATEDFFSEIDAVRKATTTDSALMHSISDSEVTMLFKNVYPATSLIPVEASKGKITQWDAIGVNEGGTAYFGSEDPDLTESDMQDHTRHATNKIMYSVMRVTKMAYEAGRAQVPARDMMTIRSIGANEMVKRLRERAILGVTRDVTSGVNAFEPPGQYEYPGLYQLITANTTDPNYIDVSSDSVATKDQIDVKLDESYINMIQDGRIPNLAICDYRTFGIYRRALNAFFHTENVKSLDYGIAKITLVFPGGEVPMVPCPYLPTTTGPNGSIFLLDTTHLARRILWAETMEELANINTSKRAVISAAEVIIDKTDVDGESSLQGGVFGITIGPASAGAGGG